MLMQLSINCSIGLQLSVRLSLHAGCNPPGNSPDVAAPALETSPQNECGQRTKRTG